MGNCDGSSGLSLISNQVLLSNPISERMIKKKILSCSGRKKKEKDTLCRYDFFPAKNRKLHSTLVLFQRENYVLM